MAGEGRPYKVNLFDAVGRRVMTAHLKNYKPIDVSDLDGAAEDYHGYALSPSSPYAGSATDGSDPGFDPAAYDTAETSH